MMDTTTSPPGWDSVIRFHILLELASLHIAQPGDVLVHTGLSNPL